MQYMHTQRNSNNNNKNSNRKLHRSDIVCATGGTKRQQKKRMKCVCTRKYTNAKKSTIFHAVFMRRSRENIFTASLVHFFCCSLLQVYESIYTSMN